MIEKWEKNTKFEEKSVTMNKTILFFIIFLLTQRPLSAQQLNESGRSVAELVPDGWDCQEAWGDLYDNGRDDLVMIVLPNHKEKVVTCDDGYEMNCNDPLLAIYYKSEEGDLIQRKVLSHLLPARDEYTSIERSISINKNGAIVIGLSYFYTAGSYDSPSFTYVFRQQDNEFYLIGEETESFSRSTGEGEKISINYLTHKQCRSTFNVFKDSNTKPTERWTKLPVKPLQKIEALSLGQ